MTDSRHCGLCRKPVHDDNYFKELDCTFPKCPGEGYHDACMDSYLRKRGRGSGTEQRTRYPCPATLANGAACPGTIKGTHNRVPVNSKKKEANREAAVAANIAVNVATMRAAATPPTPPAALKATAATVSSKSSLTPAGTNNNRPGGGLLPRPHTSSSIMALRPAADAVTQTNIKILVNNSLTPLIGAKSLATKITAAAATKANLAATAAGTGKAPPRPLPTPSAWSTSLKPLTSEAAAPAPAPAPGVRAVADAPSSVAVAPERDVRQHAIRQNAAPASLEQQRAVAAALREEVKAAAGRRGGGAVAAGSQTALESDAGARQGAGHCRTDTDTRIDTNNDPDGDSGLAGGWQMLQRRARGRAAAVEGPLGGATEEGKLDEKEEEREYRSKEDEEVEEGGEGSVDGSCGVVIELPLQPFQLASEDFPAFPSAPRATAAHAPRVRTRKPKAAPATPAPPRDTAARTPPAAPSEDLELDPVVAHDPLFTTEDGIVVVQDAYSIFVRMEDVYGASPELVGFTDDFGTPSYYVVVRQSLASALQAQHELMQATDGSYAGGAMDVAVSEPMTPPAALYDTAFGAEAAVADGQGGVHGWGSVGAYQLGKEAAVSEKEEEGEDDLGELLALCLGNTGGSSAATLTV